MSRNRQLYDDALVTIKVGDHAIPDDSKFELDPPPIIIVDSPSNHSIQVEKRGPAVLLVDRLRAPANGPTISVLDVELADTLLNQQRQRPPEGNAPRPAQSSQESRKSRRQAAKRARRTRRLST